MIKSFSGGSELREDPVIAELATKYKATPNQVILAWHIARGTVPIPKSINAERQAQNLQVCGIYIPSQRHSKS
jgi:diketogulonate reductase-like aldo/keto reductase